MLIVDLGSRKGPASHSPFLSFSRFFSILPGIHLVHILQNYSNKEGSNRAKKITVGKGLWIT